MITCGHVIRSVYTRRIYVITPYGDQFALTYLPVIGHKVNVECLQGLKNVRKYLANILLTERKQYRGK